MKVAFWLAVAMIWLLGYIAIAVMQEPYPDSSKVHPINAPGTNVAVNQARPPSGVGCWGPSGPPCVLAPRAGPPTPEWAQQRLTMKVLWSDVVRVLP